MGDPREIFWAFEDAKPPDILLKLVRQSMNATSAILSIPGVLYWQWVLNTPSLFNIITPLSCPLLLPNSPRNIGR